MELALKGHLNTESSRSKEMDGTTIIESVLFFYEKWKSKLEYIHFVFFSCFRVQQAQSRVNVMILKLHLLLPGSHKIKSTTP